MGKVTWKEAREKKGMSMAEVAKEMGISVQNYCQKENYQRAFKISEALLACKILDANINDMKVS